MTLIVNSRSALDGFLTSTALLFDRGKSRSNLRPSRARKTLVAMVVIGGLVVGLNLAFPALAALIPARQLGLVVPHHCGTQSTSGVGMKIEEYNAKFANAAFGTVDTNTNMNVSSSNANVKTAPKTASPSTSFPTIEPSYVTSCPNVSACSPDYPFTFSTNYTLDREHFAFNTDVSFSFQVFDTCYRPIQATALLPNGTNPDVTAVGIYYGPLNISGQIQDYTEMTFTQRRYAAGYTLSSYAALANDVLQENLWLPNSTLVMGGDTTLLLYYVGAVSMEGFSSDPLFATNPTAFTSDGTLFHTRTVVVPIVCDTKYVFCADGMCSPPGGANTMLYWMAMQMKKEWTDLSSLFSASLVFSPIYQASLGSVAILASETTQSGLIQYEVENCTVVRELGRLVSTSMFMFASLGQLAALGFWDVGTGTFGLDPSEPGSMCKNTLMDSSTVTTIAVLPYSILLGTLLLIVLVGKIPLWPRRRLSRPHRELLDVWTLHTPGQLHREVTERIRGRFGEIDTRAEWPTVDTYHMGPTVVTEDDVKRFGSGMRFTRHMCLLRLTMVVCRRQ
jgi:hypothetical protein